MQTAPVSPSGDVGLGTAFERWAIYRRLVDWFSGQPPRTALEGPVDGMAGMAGLHLLPLARRGTEVTVVLPEGPAHDCVETVYRRAGLEKRLRLRSTLPDRPVDLVLAFNIAPLVEDWRATLRALASQAHRHLLVFATHPGSYGVGLRRLARRFEPGPRRPELFEHEGTDPYAIRAAIAKHGDVVAEAFVDCPWWPDLFVDAGQTLWGASRARWGGGASNSESTPYDWGPETFPFATDDMPAAIHRALTRHPHFDGRPDTVARWFAHHRAYLLDRSNVDLPRAAEYP